IRRHARASDRTRRCRDDRRAARGAMTDLDAKLAEIAAQYDDLQADLAPPEGRADPSEIRTPRRELPRLEPTVAAFRTLTATRDELSGARELRDSSDGDDDLRQLARGGSARLP